ncbi:LysR family transcriptional regulator [Thalassovita taeanensis]|uniref:Transcriptional regulator, LysR family n=1 Tax=Thalassovita taeanensis TaxID=657014 RepID=A0A1H9DSB8_9RHOB|nr:LysR family transcriptional regulator [Thalassovita taeanensis]SEQ16372.1 transcriptional regulator, LysR family [Thalassovita taeanensis]
MADLSKTDWTLIQSFLAVAEAGSLSAAARRMGASQPTLGRQIRQIESDLDVTLFTRQPRGFDLTEIGRAILPSALQMQQAMHDIGLTVAGQETEARGPVRITASEVVAHFILPPIVADIRRTHPGITVVLDANDSSENLLFREADIAVRMYRPRQLEIVTRHLGDLGIGICAARSYLDLHGRPQSPDEMLQHELIGYDQSELILRGMRQMGWSATRDWFTTRCDSQTVYWQLLRAGCGIGFGQLPLIEADPDIELLDMGIDIPPLPVWLAAPLAVRQTPRIAAVWGMLEAGLKPFVS